MCGCVLGSPSTAKPEKAWSGLPEDEAREWLQASHLQSRVQDEGKRNQKKTPHHINEVISEDKFLPILNTIASTTVSKVNSLLGINPDARRNTTNPNGQF